MALTTSYKWIYPPDYQSGDYPLGGGKARGPKRWCIVLLGEGTGTEDETNVLKVQLADLITVDGERPEKMIVNRIVYECRGFSGVHLLWDRSPANIRFFSMGGNNRGEVDYKRYGGLPDTGAGGTGDLLLTTTGGTALDVYNMMIEFEVR